MNSKSSFLLDRSANGIFAGMAKNVLPPMRPNVASSPALGELANSGSFRHNSHGPMEDDGTSLGDIFKLVAQMRICVVRRAGSDVDQQISSIVKTACRTVGGGDPAPSVHFLTVDQQCARRMLDCVHRQGLPLIFLNGDCVGGLAELKVLLRSGFLAESLCPHEFDLVVVGSPGEGNVAAERAVEEGVKLGKRVALVQMARTQRSMGPNGAEPGVARQAANRMALLRNSIDEARASGWKIESEEGDQQDQDKVSLCLDWQNVRESIAKDAQKRRERMEKVFEQGKVKRFAALACRFSGTHHLTVCPEKGQNGGGGELVKLGGDRFLLVAKSEAKGLENVPGAKEFCTSNEAIFTLDHNPGRTLFFCEDDSDPALLESAAILRALGNDVTIMAHTYGSKRVGQPNGHSFDSELIVWVRDRLRRQGVRFVVSVPTKFEQLQAEGEGKAPILRVYAMSTWHGGTAEKGTGDWTPFLEEFNTVVISIGKRSSQLAQELALDTVGGRTSSMNQNGRTRGSGAPLLVPNLYVVGDLLENAKQNGTESEEANCMRARMMLRRIWGEEVNPTDQDQLVVLRTLLIPPLEYTCCGMSEAETREKYGRDNPLVRVYRDAEVPMPRMEAAKMICVKQGHRQERVLGLHLIGPGASHLLRGFVLAMQMGLTKWQMEQSWQKADGD